MNIYSQYLILKVQIYKKKLYNEQIFPVSNPKSTNLEPEALKSLYRSPGYKKKQLVLCKNYVLQW